MNKLLEKTTTQRIKYHDKIFKKYGNTDEYKQGMAKRPTAIEKYEWSFGILWKIRRADIDRRVAEHNAKFPRKIKVKRVKIIREKKVKKPFAWWAKGKYEKWLEGDYWKEVRQLVLARDNNE